jgi:hypothetical protein
MRRGSGEWRVTSGENRNDKMETMRREDSEKGPEKAQGGREPSAVCGNDGSTLDFMGRTWWFRPYMKRIKVWTKN